jgi:general nucleoside transport system ATP-binding protein
VSSMSPIAVEAWNVTKRFGAVTALDGASMKVAPGEFHALLGENGAGKSTLVKCIVGYHPVDGGSILIDGRERDLTNPRDAHALGIGMVYQHFTLVPSMTVAENLVMSRADVPAVIDWAAEFSALESFLAEMPFRVPLTTPVTHLPAGVRQKTEILKQLYLQRRFLILDEPTSVLTPAEADEMLTLLKGMTRAGRLSVLLITHKFREVMQFADGVTVLRHGRVSGTGAAAELGREALATMMVGARELPAASPRRGAAADDEPPILELRSLTALSDSGHRSIEIESLAVRRREIVGIAGVSGNGQSELVEVLAGQRRAQTGHIIIAGAAYGATRPEAQTRRVHCLPEEPMRNACVGRMSVAENLAFRNFDRNGSAKARRWLDLAGMSANARALIGTYRIKTSSPHAPLATLSGGNVQRTVLARELSEAVDVLIVANPCFGLDFSAVAEIRSRIVEARNMGAAVLLVSEDLDEILELADRVVVMSEGRIVYETPIADADVPTIGAHMAGHR